MLLPHEGFLGNLKIILGSASQGRKTLLEQLGSFKFEVMVSNFEENLPKSQYSALQYVKATCHGKVNDLMPRLTNDWDLVIFADTICDLGGKIIEKPQSKQEVTQFLRDFRGKWHSVHTCLHVLAKHPNDSKLNFERTIIETTELLFADLSDESIEYYSNDESLWRGRAGGYAIQGKGVTMIKEIRGCYTNIIGLPLHRLSEIILEVIEFMKQ